MNRFDYVKYDAYSMGTQQKFKELFMDLEKFVDDRLEPGRAKALVLTKLEEAYMWVGKSVRDTQVEKRGATLQEDRSDE